MNKIEREKKTMRKMISLYCSRHLLMVEPSDEYCELADYACKRLDKCRYGVNKGTCKKCPTHCYKPDMREKMREVMRWAGPRMIVLSPRLAMRHIIDGMKKPRV